MNDRTEMDYGLAVVASEFERQRARLKPSRISKMILEEFSAFSNGHSSGKRLHHAYAFCFCEQKDSLSQWREYASRGTGYAIGFYSSGLRALGLGDSASTSLHRVVYDAAEQRRLVAATVKSVFRLAERYSDEADDDGERAAIIAAAILSSALDDLAASFKDPAFANEREWRLVTGLSGESHRADIKFRASAGAIMPHISVIPAQGRLKIAEVVLGPQVAPEISESGVQLFLQSHGYERVRRTMSAVPTRF